MADRDQLSLVAHVRFARGLACAVGCMWLTAANLLDSAQGQVVQLPSYRNFSYSGSAWVPDAGTASVAGTSYASSASTTRGWGPYAGTAQASGLGGSSVTANVEIIDLQALDEAILAAKVPPPASTPPANAANNNAAANQPAEASKVGVVPSRGVYVRDPYLTSSPQFDRDVVDAAGWQRALGGSQPTASNPTFDEANMRYYLSLAREAEKANRLLASRVYYKLAMEAMTPEMLARYHRILADRAATPPPPADAGRQKF